MRRRHVERDPGRVDRGAHSRLVDLLRDRTDERVEFCARVRYAQRNRGAHLVAAEVSNGAAKERPLAAALQRLAHHPVRAEPRFDVGRPQLPAVVVPPEEDPLLELGAQAPFENVSGPRRVELPDVDPPCADPARDHVRAGRVVGVEAAGARREDEQDCRNTDREDALFHPIPVVLVPDCKKCYAGS